MTNTYSLLRSKTFWMIVFLFVFNGFAAIQGSVSPDVSVAVNGVLAILASIFHLQTGKSMTGSN